MSAGLLGLVALAVPEMSVDAGRGCAQLAQELAKALAGSVMAMEPEGSRRTVYQRATGAAARCPENEPLAYIRLRAAELGGAPPDDVNRLTTTKLIGDLCRQFPRSVRIATIRARFDGSVESARAASKIDPSYAPAQVALASALSSAGQLAAARMVIDGVGRLPQVDDGFSVLAKIKWAQGEVAGAIAAANLELKGRDLLRLEPGGGDAKAIMDAHEILGLAYAKKGKPDQAAPHLLLAEPVSPRVQEVLRAADPALGKALAKARRHHENECRDDHRANLAP